jgi:hypothetical protein
MNDKVEYYFPSKSVSERHHTLMELNSGWDCDCLAKPFNPKLKQCRHIEILRWYLANHPQMILYIQ